MAITLQCQSEQQMWFGNSAIETSLEKDTCTLHVKFSVFAKSWKTM